jgi:large subunit ribosomal protein L9
MKKQGIKVVLLERIQRLGGLGDVVTVKAGFARNFLLLQSKALRATAANIAQFEQQKEHLQKENAHKLTKAEERSKELEHKVIYVVRQASEAGILYGSVGPRDVAAGITDTLQEVTRHQVLMAQPIKTLGVHIVAVSLHPELSVPVTVSIAQTVEEAKAQIRKAKEESEAMKAEKAEAAQAAKAKKASAKAEEVEDEAVESAEAEDEKPAAKKKSTAKAKK